MRNAFFAFIALLFVTSCADLRPRSVQSKVNVVAIQNALLRKMELDHFLSGDWAPRMVRPMRIVTLTNGTSLVAFEVFSNDFSRSGDIHWQVATIDYEGVRSEWSVLFPGQPCSPDMLRSDLGLLEGVTGADVEMLKTGAGCLHTQFVFEPKDRIYQHGKEWKLKIEAMEQDMNDFVADVGIRNGEIIVNDIEDSDEEFKGLAMDHDRALCWRLSGVVLKSRSSSVYPIHSALYNEPVDKVSPSDLERALHAPLLWSVRSVAGKGALIRKNSQFKNAPISISAAGSNKETGQLLRKANCRLPLLDFR